MNNFWQKQAVAIARLRYYLKVVTALRSWLKNTPKPPLGTYIDLGPATIFLGERGNISLRPSKSVELIVCKRGQLEATLADLDFSSSGTSWQELLVTDEIAVYEQSELREDLPLRRGLTSFEERELSNFVRAILTAALGHKELPQTPKDGRLAKQGATIDVALWVKGELRGSQIATAASLYEAAREATLRAMVDPRFKPLSADELSQLRIETSYMDDLLLPLPETSTNNPETLSYSELGYRLLTMAGVGWFVPAVFNVLPLKTLSQIKSSLATKINYREKTDECELAVFYTQTWIEDSQLSGSILKVDGPIVKVETKNSSKIAADAVAHICYNQEVDGYLPARLFPDRVGGVGVDFIRLAHALYALGEYEQQTKNEVVRRTLEAGYQYLRRHLFTYPSFTPPSKALTLCYALRAIKRLGREEDEKKARAELLALVPSLTYEPILFSQVAFTYISDKNSNEEERALAYELVAKVEQDFRNKVKSGEVIPLAHYPELMTLLSQVPENCRDGSWLREEEVVAWYQKQQLPNGAFRDTQSSRFSYVRGTAKILECLPLSLSSERALAWKWISTMQYSKDNLYHVPLATQPKFLGGFRHDVFERSAWLDAAAHVVIAATKERFK